LKIKKGESVLNIVDCKMKSNNVEVLFETNMISEIEEIEKKLKEEVEKKVEDLKQIVGYVLFNEGALIMTF